MSNSSIQRFARREQIGRIERLAADLDLDRTDILIDAEERGRLPFTGQIIHWDYLRPITARGGVA